MCWQVSELILRSWRNRVRSALRRHPALFLLVGLLPLIYLQGAVLTHLAIYRVLSDMSRAALPLPSFREAIAYSFSSSFGLTAFLLVVLATLISPEENLLTQTLAPLPIPRRQVRIGLLMPAGGLLLLAQAGVWAPPLAAFVRGGFGSPLGLLGACLLGLVCYATLALLLLRVALLAVGLIFGSDRVAPRAAAVPLAVVVGLIALTVASAAGESALLTGSRPGWLWLVPGRWMALVVDGGRSAATGLALLAGTAVGAGLAVVALLGLDDAAARTRGGWSPLRGLPFPTNQLVAGAVYELKSLARDEQVVLGASFVALTAVGATGAVGWLRVHTDNLWSPLIAVATGYLVTLLLCIGAQMSWGRDRDSRRVLAVTPLNPALLVMAKVAANMAAVGLLWLLLLGLLTSADGQPQMLLQLAPLVPLGCLFAFLVGIVIPYSPKDPLSIVLAATMLLLFGAPAQVGAQQAGAFVQQALALSPRQSATLAAAAYVISAVAGLLLTLRLDAVRMQRVRA
jgi:hypothetical protein